MQLQIKRTQREGGMLSKNVIFCLDARAHLTPEETNSVVRYKLYSQVIYNSESSKRSLDKAMANSQAGTLGGFVKGMAHLAISSLKLNITVGSLTQGHHIECKDMDELLGAEEALYAACENLKQYLDMAATFDGRTVVIDFDGGAPQATLHEPINNPSLIAPAPVHRQQQAIPQLITTDRIAAPSEADVLEEAVVEAVPDEDANPFVQTMMSSFASQEPAAEAQYEEVNATAPTQARPEPVVEDHPRYADHYANASLAEMPAVRWYMQKFEQNQPGTIITTLFVLCLLYYLLKIVF